jgi:hypothetical protein
MGEGQRAFSKVMSKTDLFLVIITRYRAQQANE